MYDGRQCYSIKAQPIRKLGQKRQKEPVDLEFVDFKSSSVRAKLGLMFFGEGELAGTSPSTLTQTHTNIDNPARIECPSSAEFSGVEFKSWVGGLRSSLGKTIPPPPPNIHRHGSRIIQGGTSQALHWSLKETSPQTLVPKGSLQRWSQETPGATQTRCSWPGMFRRHCLLTSPGKPPARYPGRLFSSG